MAKAVDTLRNLLNNDPAKLAQHVLIDERPVDSYLLSEWRWNESRYPISRSLRELVEALGNVRRKVTLAADEESVMTSLI